MGKGRAPSLLAGFVLAVSSWCTVARGQEDALPQLYLRGQPVYLRGQLLDGKGRVVGIEEGDNGFRYRTPGLERAARISARVPRGELQRKRLAMYSPAATTLPGLAPRPAAGSGRERGPGPRRPDPRASGALPKDDTVWSLWPWVLSLVAGAGAWALGRSRSRRFPHRT